MYDRNHYFGLGPKPQMDDTITSQNHISKKGIYLPIVWSIFFHHKRYPKTKFATLNIKDFQIIFVDLCSVLSFSKQTKNCVHSPKKWDKLKLFLKKKSEKFQLRYRNFEN